MLPSPCSLVGSEDLGKAVSLCLTRQRHTARGEARFRNVQLSARKDRFLLRFPGVSRQEGQEQRSGRGRGYQPQGEATPPGLGFLQSGSGRHLLASTLGAVGGVSASLTTGEAALQEDRAESLSSWLLPNLQSPRGAVCFLAGLGAGVALGVLSELGWELQFIV